MSAHTQYCKKKLCSDSEQRLKHKSQQTALSKPFQIDSLPWQRGTRIIKSDSNGLIAVNKPEGVLSHPNRKSDTGKSLLGAPYDADLQAYIVPGGNNNESQFIYLLNRLDSSTSGALLFTISDATRAAVLEAFEKRRVTKVYQALVFGNAKAKGRQTIWKDRLQITRSGGTVRSSAGSGKSAETELISARPVPGTPITSLLKLKPITGRTHQLRVQCAKRHLPIVGDRTYGNFQKNKLYARNKGIKRLCLHSSETKLEYTIKGETFRFQAATEAPF